MLSRLSLQNLQILRDSVYDLIEAVYYVDTKWSLNEVNIQSNLGKSSKWCCVQSLMVQINYTIL